MPIRSGIGIGEAQVFDSSKLANQYARLVAADQANLQKQAIANQKRNDEYQKSLNSKLDGVPLLGKGLHAKDSEDFVVKWEAIRGLAREANAATKDVDRIAKTALVEKAIFDTSQWVGNAQRVRADINKIAGESLKNPSLYSPENQKLIHDISDKSYSQIEHDYPTGYDVTKLQQIPDQSEILNSFEDLEKTTVNSAKQNYKKLTTAKAPGDQSVNIFTANPDDVYNTALLMVGANNKLNAALQYQYQQANPEKGELGTPQELAGLFVGNFEKSKGGASKAYTVAGSPTKNATQSLTQEEKDAANQGNYQYEEDKIFSSEDTYEDGKLVKSGEPVINFQKFIVAPVKSSFTVPQIDNVKNISTGVNEKMYSTSGLIMTGLGYSNGKLVATVVDKDDTEYAINEKDIPASVKNSKQYQGAIKKLKISQSGSGYSNVVDAFDAENKPMRIGKKNGKWFNVKTGKEI